MMTAKNDRLWAHALILFRSPGLFRYYLLHGQFGQAQMVEQRFQVRAVLRTRAHETRFHLLALSQRHVRLLHCTQHRFEPAIDGETIPQDMQSVGEHRQPDRPSGESLRRGPVRGWDEGRSKRHGLGSRMPRSLPGSFLQRRRKGRHRTICGRIWAPCCWPEWSGMLRFTGV